MKKALAICGALLLAGLGFTLPRLAAAYQDQALAGDVRELENAAVSLALAQEMVEIPELDLLHSLELCSSFSEGVPLEDGQKTSRETALQIAAEVVEYMRPVPFVIPSGDAAAPPDEAIPLLITDAAGRSGIFWRCGWAGHEDESIWIDDAHSSLAGFCLRGVDNPITEDIIGVVICEHFFPSYVDAGLIRTADGGYYIELSQNGETVFLSVGRRVSAVQNGYLCFNSPNRDDSATGEPTDQAENLPP